MNLPDTSNTEKMAQIGRITVIRRARLDAAKKLRDKLIPMLNSIENADRSWDVSGVVELLEEIQAASAELEKLQNQQPK